MCVWCLWMCLCVCMCVHECAICVCVCVLNTYVHVCVWGGRGYVCDHGDLILVLLVELMLHFAPKMPSY